MAGELPPAERAIRWLAHAQVTEEFERDDGRDWAGNWPQTVSIEGTDYPPPIGDVNPFLATFVHHALCQVGEEEAAALGLQRASVKQVREMRDRSVELMQRFEAFRSEDGAAGYSFWPARDRQRTLPQKALGEIALAALGGPQLHGTIAPHNIPAYPPELQIWPDADDTALIYFALAEEGEAPVGIASLLARWRDDGNWTLRQARDLPPSSGLFLTWLIDEGPATVSNDVDLLVNANVLRSLAKLSTGDVPGFNSAVAEIVRATRERRHHDIARVCDYYPDRLTFAWLVTRACREGPVPGLAPAVEILVAEVEAAAIPAGGGAFRWDGECAELATAQACLTLLDADRAGALVDGGAKFLRRTQDKRDGGWPAGTLCVGRSTSGLITRWKSRAFTTALALELLCRQRR